MGRNRKSLQEHLLHGTYRADRHGNLTNPTSGCVGMHTHNGETAASSANGNARMPDSDDRYAGLDFDFQRKMLVGAESLAWCFECDASTIRRWAANGTMPKPLKVGGRTLWDGERIREWIREGCPRCDSE